MKIMVSNTAQVHWHLQEENSKFIGVLMEVHNQVAKKDNKVIVARIDNPKKRYRKAIQMELVLLERWMKTYN